jgi:lipid-binding SYLF domain-containing protein
MMAAKGHRKRSGHRRTAVAALLTFLVLLSGTGPARADDAQDAAQLVDMARSAFDAFVADGQMGPPLKSLLRQARAVLIYPSVLRLAFIFGGSGGSGVMLARDVQANAWGGPAFYTIGRASFGFQAGGEMSEIVLVALTERGMTALLSTTTEFGANAAVAAGPVGAGATAATAGLSADIVSYSLSKGLYAGASLEGAVVATRGSLNQAYYGKEVTPTDILLKRAVTNPHAAGLIQAVESAAKAN